MKKFFVLPLFFITAVIFTSCTRFPQETASAAELITSTVTSVSSEPANAEETSSAPASAVESPESVSSEQTPATSEPLKPSTCTHPYYWEGKGEGLHFITGWYDKQPGIEHKFTLYEKCEEPRDVIYKCPSCSEPVLVETIEPSGHDFSGEEEVLLYPTVNSEGSIGKTCQNLLGCDEVLLIETLPKRGGSYDTIDACFTVDIDSDNNRESYDIETDNISIVDYRTWGDVPTIEFDQETYIGTISYVLQDGTLYQRRFSIDKTKLTDGVHYLGKILESGEYEGHYWSLSANGTAPK